MQSKFTAVCPVHGDVTLVADKRPAACTEGTPICGHALAQVKKVRKPGSGGRRPGQGRPKSENKLDLVPLNVKIVGRAKQRLADLAEASGVSQALIIEHLLAQVETLPDNLGGFRDDV